MGHVCLSFPRPYIRVIVAIALPLTFGVTHAASYVEPYFDQNSMFFVVLLMMFTCGLTPHGAKFH